MMMRRLLASTGMLALVACASNSSFSTTNTDEASLKSSPAGLATFGFLDILNILPANLTTGSYASCITPTVNGTTTTLAYNGCSSTIGGTLTGTVGVGVTASGSTVTYVEDFASLANALSSSVTWTYAGKLDVVVKNGSSALTAEDGFLLSVADTLHPARTKVWAFTCSLTSTTDSAGAVTLQGTYTFKVDSSDSVTVVIDATNPLVWASGGSYPTSGTLSITDSRTGQTDPQTVAVVFSQGTVTLDGVAISLGNS